MAIKSALEHGDAQLVGERVLLRAIIRELEREKEINPLLSRIYGDEAISYNPTKHAQWLIPTKDYHDVFPLLVGNDGHNFALAGKERDFRFLAYGDCVMWHFEHAKSPMYEAAFQKALRWLVGGKVQEKKHIALSFIKYDDLRDTKNYLAKNYPNWEVEECHVDGLDSCYEKADLIITGWQGENEDAKKIAQTLGDAKAENIPILYMHTWYEATNQVADAIAKVLGFTFSYGGNYWAKEQVDFANLDAMKQRYAQTQGISKMQQMISHFQNNDYHFDWSGCDGQAWSDSCGQVVGYHDSFLNVVRDIQSRLRKLDEENRDIFAQNNYKLEKLLILLGDIYRQKVHFPMDKNSSDSKAFLTALFSDYTVYNSRKINRVQKDMGTFGRSDFSSIIPHTKRRIMISNAPFRAAGVYMLPGVTMKVRRVDSSDVNVKIFVNTLRQESTHEYRENGYNRPKFLQSTHVALKAGESIELTSPYGGPVEVAFDSNAKEVELIFENIAEHPFWESSADDLSFSQKFAQKAFDWVEVVTPHFEVHSTMHYMEGTFDKEGWREPALLAEGIEKYIRNYPNILAGFQGEGIDKIAEIHDFALEHNLSVQTDNQVKHMNADQQSCGWGCSGNPYDAGWSFSPVAHGDIHEYGHGLEDTKRMLFAGFEGHATTNPYAYYSKSAYHKESGKDPDCQSLPFKELFEKLQAARQAEDSMAYLQRELWEKSNWSQQVLVMIEAMMHTQKMGKLENGWHLLARLHILSRSQKDALEKWELRRDNIGFGTYSKEEFEKISNNDWMLVSISFASTLDFRPYFDMMGLAYSQKAAQQVKQFAYDKVAKKFFVSTGDGYCKSDRYGDFLGECKINCVNPPRSS